MHIRSLVGQGSVENPTMADELVGCFDPARHDRLDVAVAYATQSGLSLLKRAFGNWPAESRWVLGVDDGITQPIAIKEVATIQGASLKIANLAPEGRRFHPKLYCLWSSGDPTCCILALGSGNMTLHGLKKNGEAGVLLEAETAEEAQRLKHVWEDMNALGCDFDQFDLAGYEVAYKAARNARRRQSKATPETTALIEDNEPTFEGAPGFDGQPRNAKLAWLEAGSPSAGGRDLEFPKKLMPFFRLNQSPTTMRFRTPRGTVHELTFTERHDNQMWRLLFSRDVIEDTIFRQTMRPAQGGNRSDLAIIFTRSDGDAAFDLQMVVIGSEEHTMLRERSAAAGELCRTRNPGGRDFGFF